MTVDAVNADSDQQQQSATSDQRHWSAISTTGDAQLMRLYRRRGPAGRGGDAIRPNPAAYADRPPACPSAASFDVGA